MTQEQIPQEYEQEIRKYLGDTATVQTFKTFKRNEKVYKVIGLYKDWDEWKEQDAYYVVCAFSLNGDIAVSIDAGATNDVKTIVEGLFRRMRD